MKKQVIFISIFVVIGAIIIMTRCFRKPLVGEFELSDYQYFVENFSSEEILGEIIDSKDAIIKAEKTWIKIYGEGIKDEKPYRIFYDSKNDVWLIQGSLQSNSVGGVANILITGNNGKVLAVWHEK